jgi:hypothetical protein
VNRIFSKVGEGWPEFPTVSYGRLDQVEPLDPLSASEAVFAFDVVDADWPQFSPTGDFDLSDVLRLRSRQRAFWQRMFGPPTFGRPQDPFVAAPIYRIEITSRRGDSFFDFLTKLGEHDWVKITLDRIGTFEVDVYGGLFAAPVQAYLIDIGIEMVLAEALSVTFDMDAWLDASETSIRTCLSGLPKFEFLIAYDIGQGSANGLADARETAQLFFDLGCGVYGNRHTRPVPLRFCWQAHPPVILSHWDSDHWAGETSDPAAQAQTWIAPRQVIGPTHTAFASRILSAGGTIHIWGPAPSTICVTVGGTQTLTLARCTGTTRNGSGISCLVEDSSGSQGWLVTGDAGYHELGQPHLPADLRAVVVPHHGADMGTASIPPSRPSGYARLFYSFGPGNAHGRTHVQHPTVAGISAHAASGWKHHTWPSGTPATCLAGGDVLATATHPGTHLDGAVASWSSAPAVPFTTVPHAPSAASGTGCTGSIVQA